MTYLSRLSVPDFVESEFDQCNVGDPRRIARVKKIAAAMATSPGASIAHLFQGDSYSMNAAYDFFKRPEATPDNIMAAHRERTRERCLEVAARTVLLIEDTSEISYSGGRAREGLGPIGNRRNDYLQGFRLHSVLAARLPEFASYELEGERRDPVELLGLLDQQFLVRSEEQLHDKNPDYGSKRKRMIEKLESERWPESIKRSSLGEEEMERSGVRCIRVADREADMYEYLLAIEQAGEGFVVRACQNRRLQDKDSGERCGHLIEAARKAKALKGSFQVHLRSRGGVKARTANLSIAVVNDLQIQAPQRPGHGPGFLDPIPVSVVRIWESKPPRGVKEPLEWILLSSEPAKDFAEAREIAHCYSCRWIIEEFHKALKSGMKAEDLQLETGERLMAAIAIMGVVALRLVDIRERVRLTPEAPPEEGGIDDIDIKILQIQTKRNVYTIRDALRAIGKMGGFIGRKGDGEPGMITLWRGITKLQALKEGYLLAMQINGPTTSQE